MTQPNGGNNEMEHITTERILAETLKTTKPTLLTLSEKCKQEILLKLGETISFRAAEGSREYFRLMAERLSKENFDYTIQALTNLGERERGEGETALLTLASILKEIRTITPKPKTRVELDEEIMAEERRKALREVGGE
jgi:hypothetical protein